MLFILSILNKFLHWTRESKISSNNKYPPPKTPELKE